LSQKKTHISGLRAKHFTIFSLDLPRRGFEKGGAGLPPGGSTHRSGFAGKNFLTGKNNQTNLCFSNFGGAPSGRNGLSDRLDQAETL